MDLFSRSFIPTTKEAPKGAEAISHILGLRAGLFFMASAGIYSYLPLGYKVLRNIEGIIRKHMNRAGAQEIFMSSLQPIEIWQVTGRDKDLQDIMLRFKDRKSRQLCLGPTHEELITEIVKKYTSSYKQLPFTLYQIQTKFRDEIRPRFGLLRSCEFTMKDAYSFDADFEGLDKSYEAMRAAYCDIFDECGLEARMVEAESGVMGGKVSHEFMVQASVGEDLLFYCKQCGKYLSKEGRCSKCGRGLEKQTMIEVGHIFKLGTKYSLAQGSLYLDPEGQRRPVVMGCYGIGVSRIISAVIETSNDDRGIIWPRNISPYDVIVLALDEGILSEATAIAEKLDKEKLKVLIDDRRASAGVKFNDAYLLGIPYILIMGKKYKESRKIDLEIRRTHDKSCLSAEQLVNFLKDEYSRQY